MRGRADNAYLHGLFKSGFAGGETPVGRVGIMSFYGIADVVGEDSHLWHLRNILLERAFFDRQGRVSCCPPLSVDEYVGIDLLQRCCHLIHCLDVMYGHEVETETVDMIFLCPVFHGIDNEVTHLLAVGGRLVATSRSVAVAPVRAVAVIVAGGREREI